MLLFPTLRMFDGNITADQCKIHLASLNDIGEKPLDVYFAGKFDEWESRQTRKNFELDWVVSLIQLPMPHRWLFAGVQDKIDFRPNPGYPSDGDKIKFLYTLKPHGATKSLTGRLVIAFDRSGRNSYRNAERCEKALEIVAYRAEPYVASDFNRRDQFPRAA